MIVARGRPRHFCVADRLLLNAYQGDPLENEVDRVNNQPERCKKDYQGNVCTKKQPDPVITGGRFQTWVSLGYFANAPRCNLR
jgi:hypothetical protein